MKDTFAVESFKRLDTDGNGSISLDEFKAGKRFGKHHRFGARGGHRGALKVR
jgi:hypothetical protein